MFNTLTEITTSVCFCINLQPKLYCNRFIYIYIYIYYIQEELNGSGRLLGYRAMWNRLRVTHQINASQYVFIIVYIFFKIKNRSLHSLKLKTDLLIAVEK